MNWKKIGIIALALFVLLVIADPNSAAGMVDGGIGVAKDAANSMKTFVVAVFN